MNINPTLAFKANEELSIGLGLNFMYMKAELTNSIDCGAFLGSPQNRDGFARLKGDSWGFGFNLGILYEFTKNTRFGLSYRSKVKQKLEGNAYFYDIPSPLNLLPNFQDDKINSIIKLPDTLSLSFYHDVNDKLSLMTDITWTGWKTLNEIRIRFQNGRPDSVITTSWNNSMRYSIGASSKINEKLTLRTGIAYDETPIPDAKHRTPRIPDTDRFWIALGAGYKFSDRLTADIGYVHIFFKDSHIDKEPVEEDRYRGGLKGSYKGSVDIIGVQLTYNF